MPSGIMEKEETEEDAPGLDHPGSDIPSWIIWVQTRRSGPHPQSRNIRGQQAKGKAGMARRHRAATTRRRNQRKMHLDRMIQRVPPQAASYRAKHEADATTPTAGTSAKKGPKAKGEQ